MGNLINVPIRYEFHFVDKDKHEKVVTTQKIRRLRRLRDVLNIGLLNCSVPDGAWRVCSYSASPAKMVDRLERIRCPGVLVIYAEPSEKNNGNGVDLSIFSSTVTFDIRLNKLQIVKYEIRVPSSTTLINALTAFVRAHSCCSSDFEVQTISRNGQLVSGCDRVQDKAEYIVELKASESNRPVNKDDFTVYATFVQDDENNEIALNFPPDSIVRDLKERLKFIKIDHVCYVDQQFGALAIVDDTSMLIPRSKYMLDAESMADQNLIEPLKREFQKLVAKPVILTPANLEQSMILRRNSLGLQVQMGSLYDANSGKFTPIHYPVEILINNLSRQKYGNVALKSSVSPADPWALVDSCGLWQGDVDCFGIKTNEQQDPDRMFYYLYERKTGILSMDITPNFYENVEIGSNTHVLNGAVMGIYFVLAIFFEDSEKQFDRKTVLEDLNTQLTVPYSKERPPLSDNLIQFESNIRISLYAPDILNLATPFTLKGCTDLIDNFTVNDGQEVQLEHWLLPLHQILPLERLKSTNIVAYEPIPATNGA